MLGRRASRVVFCFAKYSEKDLRKGNIILLNGTSSSGKTTIANAISKVIPSYFRFSIDDFDYVIEKMEDRSNGKLIPINTEIFFHRTIKMFSNYGVNTIIDHVLLDEDVKKDFYQTLSSYPLICIGVICPLEVLIAREIKRGDRIIGLAEEQYENVHKNMEYDLEINTNDAPVNECVVKIIDIMKQSA
ncbi:MAG: AAA family ATPase [Fibrobacteres bacterium]|nr:AAA family ATPase [Fibrobacterota bacterium]